MWQRRFCPSCDHDSAVVACRRVLHREGIHGYRKSRSCFHARGLAWSPEAIEDIETTASYLERDSPWYAKAVASKIVETAQTIPEFPELGRVVPEIADEAIRERFVYSYRIIDRVESERVPVAAVTHGSRLLQPFVQRIEGTQKSDH